VEFTISGYCFTKPPMNAIQFPMVDFLLDYRHCTSLRLTMKIRQVRAEK
jgi:hypothetical protein